jgi:hypothetical protein
MVRKLAIIAVVICPVVLISGFAGCSWTGQPGGSGSEAVTIGPGGIQPANDWRYMNGEPMDARNR